MNNHKLSIFQFYFLGPLMLGLIAFTSIAGLWTAIFIPCFLAIAIFSFGIFMLNYQEKIGKYFAPQWFGISTMVAGIVAILSQTYFL